MIGLYDIDLYSLSQNGRLYVPNLELMKLARYYQEEEKKVVRLIPQDEDNLEKYEKIFYFSENNDISIPIKIRRLNNVIYGGTAFTKNKYCGFENDLIDYMEPQINIYKEFLRNKYIDGVKSKNINEFLYSSYYRASVNGEVLPIFKIVKYQNFYIYDRDFFFEGWYKNFNKIAQRKIRKICTVHPIECKDAKNYFLLKDCNMFSASNKIIFNFDLNFKEYKKYIEENRIKFLSTILQSSNVYIPVGGTLSTSKLYRLDIIDCLNKLYTYWANGIPIKVKYIAPNIGNYNPVESFGKFLECWSVNSVNKKDKSIYVAAQSQPNKNKEVLDMINRIRIEFPQYYYLFNQTWNNLNDRRIWRV